MNTLFGMYDKFCCHCLTTVHEYDGYYETEDDLLFCSDICEVVYRDEVVGELACAS